ncbi:hypothetical protein [Bifidobacterium callitrichos]|uniref:Uncharacterized protein n=1 Tax=Bifidobacterium callitrichos DSM 23973 TaxID=1437609 RepID=A0A087A2Z5_9BIFI|nr:hypothetical protein [Bifidobacterium callitrichos]KFI53145.1 hypothetical protein BCAL_2046 [Bifidobacterium callitrichos DSM 23973]
MADNEYDFFANGDGPDNAGGYDEYDGDDGSRRRRHPRAGQNTGRSAGQSAGQAGQAAQSSSASRPSGRTTTYRAGFGSEPARRSRTAAIIALIAGLSAVVFGALSAAHESAPALVDPDGKVPGRYIALTCGICIAIAFVSVIVAKANLPRNSRRHRVAAGGIVTLLVAGLLLAFGVVCGVLFPDGLFKPAIRDEAPVDSAESMRFGIERATGECKAGWTDLDVSMFPGVKNASLCAETRVAYVTFDSNTTKRLYDNPLQGKIAELLTQNADDPATQGDWRLLSGNEWIAFGPSESMTTLEHEWGGELTTITPAGDDDGQS